MKPLKNINVNYCAIQKEIDDNYSELDSGEYDIYDFCGYISTKYFKDVDPLWGERDDEDPYTDLLFAMIEINGLYLY